jgi:hypothetical protein
MPAFSSKAAAETFFIPPKTAQLSEPSQLPFGGKTVGTLVREVVVPETSGAQTADSVNLGILEVTACEGERKRVLMFSRRQ